uniref:Uncharacterized protein ycf35 n=1 Tax=Ceramothamnion japonicum TaxID=218448 RepID=A0A1C9CDC5_CERJP|nr:hypothetical protein Ceram_110 [Ceramium japonicum]AOM66386.1 hypothetical protein Ceram_110 [Ceramium japonicum]
MSHFSKVQTSINDISLLKKTLTNLGFHCNDQIKFIKDANGRIHDVNLIAKSCVNQVTDSLIGFFWENDHYSVIVDLDFWNKNSSFNLFIEQLNQNYALNMILQKTEVEGFEKVKQYNLSDGSLKLTVQRWI